MSQRLCVTPEPVVQNGGRVVGKENDPAMTAVDRGLDHRLDQRNGPIRIAAERIDQHGAVRAHQGDRRQQALFFQQRRRATKIAGDDDIVGEEVQRELKLYQGSRLSSDSDLPLCQGESGFVVPSLGGYESGQSVSCQPQQVVGIVGSQTVIADGVECRGQRGCCSRVAVGHPGRDRVKDQICGARWILGRRCGPSGLRCFGDQLAVAGARRPDGRSQRFEVHVTSSPGRKRLDPLSRTEQELGSFRATALVKGDLPPQLLSQRGAQLGPWLGVDNRQEPER